MDEHGASRPQRAGQGPERIALPSVLRSTRSLKAAKSGRQSPLRRPHLLFLEIMSAGTLYNQLRGTLPCEGLLRAQKDVHGSRKC